MGRIWHFFVINGIFNIGNSYYADGTPVPLANMQHFPYYNGENAMDVKILKLETAFLGSMPTIAAFHLHGECYVACSKLTVPPLLHTLRPIFIDTKDVLCVHVAYGAVTRLNDGTKRPSVSNCSSQWKVEDCQCTICGFDDDLGVPLGRHDCSAVAGEAE